MIVLLFVFSIVAFVRTSSLRSRLAAAEQRLEQIDAALRGLSAPHPPAEPVPAKTEAAPPERSKSVPPPLELAPVSSAPWGMPEEPAAEAVGPVAPPSLPDTTAPSLVATAVAWLLENWFYAVSALSLALAGIFAAQYAAERGMLSPQMRLALAAAFGMLLIGAGEVIRRRWGDEPESATAYLPSVFSGAGLVTLYGTVLTGQMLYALITPEMTLALLVLVAAAAIAMGWFYGPLLAVVGLSGATAAPFLAGGEPGAAWLIQGYFGLVMLAGLSVNALKKWRWMTELALVLPFGAASLVQLGMAGDGLAYLVFAALFPVVGSIFLGGAVVPKFDRAGPILALARGTLQELRRENILPLLVWAAGLAGVFWVGQSGREEVLLAIAALVALFLLGVFWSRHALGATDFPILTGAALTGLSMAIRPGFVAPEFARADGSLPVDATAFYLLVGGALVVSLAAAWRSAQERGAAGVWWAQGAALLGPGLLALQELAHRPGEIIGQNLWASLIMAFAAIATLLAERARRVDGDEHSRTSLAALAAMSLIALAGFVVLSKAALSVALAVLVLGAAAMDMRWSLRHLSWFAQAAIAVLVFRAVVDPGLDWAWYDASYLDLMLGYGLPAALLAASWLVLRDTARDITRAALEGGFAVVLGAGVSIFIVRQMAESSAHLEAGMIGVVWLLSGWASMRTAWAKGDGAIAAARWVRRLNAAVSFIVAGAALLGAVTIFNPLLWGGRILGPVVFSSLALAYLVPGLLVAVMAVRLPKLGRKLRFVIGGAGGLLVAQYLFLSVAQAWRGNRLGAVAMGEGELWSYTALLLVIGAALLLAALVRRLTWLRYLADGVLVLAIAKVFLVDASDLEGLVRAGSFLILGLALAGLAWINRLAAKAIAQGPDGPR